LNYEKPLKDLNGIDILKKLTHTAQELDTSKEFVTVKKVFIINPKHLFYKSSRQQNSSWFLEHLTFCSTDIPEKIYLPPPLT
jgi:hypothetical protein